MPAFFHAHNKDYVLDDEGVMRVQKELSRLAPRHDSLVCDLTDGRMTLDALETLPSKLASSCGSKIVALDLSFNTIGCNSWEDIEPVLDELLEVVGSVDLGNNYLPALETLKQNARLSQKFKNFGNRLSLLDYDSKDEDFWLSNARAFKQLAYGCRYTED